ncbi:MAG: hypothetical protein WBG43_08055 [Marinifilaceae bacterium]
MRTKTNMASLLSGSLQNGYYLAHQNGKLFLKKRPKKKNKEEWSDKQQIMQTRMSCMSKFASHNLHNLIRPIWNTYKLNGISGYPLFIKSNKQAFAANGKIFDYSLLMVSIGSLPLAYNASINIQKDSNKFTVKWECDEFAVHSSLFDFFSYALIDKSNKIHVFHTDTYRESKEINLESNKKLENGDCVYVFFSSKQRDKFSNSLALKVKF